MPESEEPRMGWAHIPFRITAKPVSAEEERAATQRARQMAEESERSRERLGPRYGAPVLQQVRDLEERLWQVSDDEQRPVSAVCHELANELRGILATTAAEMMQYTTVPDELLPEGAPCSEQPGCDGQCCKKADEPLTFTQEEAEAALKFMIKMSGRDEEWTPPPPGDTREQLPDAVLHLIRPYMKNYVSTACETAFAITRRLRVADSHTDEEAKGLAMWRERMWARCRANQKYTGQLCTAPHHAHNTDGDDDA